MSLDKAIKHKKEKREPYRGSKAYCKTCRNNGGCEWCKENRTHKYEKSTLIDDEMQKEIDTAISIEQD